MDLSEHVIQDETSTAFKQEAFNHLLVQVTSEQLPKPNYQSVTIEFDGKSARACYLYSDESQHEVTIMMTEPIDAPVKIALTTQDIDKLKSTMPASGQVKLDLQPDNQLLITTTEGYRAKLNVLPITQNEKSCSVSVICSLKVAASDLLEAFKGIQRAANTLKQYEDTLVLTSEQIFFAISPEKDTRIARLASTSSNTTGNDWKPQKVVFSLNQPVLQDLLKQLKHAKVGEAKVSLVEHDKQLELRVETLHRPHLTIVCNRSTITSWDETQCNIAADNPSSVAFDLFKDFD